MNFEFKNGDEKLPKSSFWRTWTTENFTVKKDSQKKIMNLKKSPQNYEMVFSLI